MPLGRRPLFAVTLGLWLAVLLAMLLGSATVLAVNTTSLGDMRWIGTDPVVTSLVFDRLFLYAGLVLLVCAMLIRTWVGGGAQTGGAPAATTNHSISESAVAQAGVIRVVAGAALVLTAFAGVVIVQIAHLFG